MNVDYYSIDPTSFRYISHYGTPGMKWGVRRFQNPDGSLKAAGKGRYDGEPMPKSQLGKVKAVGDRVHKALYTDTGRKWSKDLGYYRTEEFKGKTLARNASNAVRNKANQVKNTDISKALGLDARKDLGNAQRRAGNAQSDLNRQYNTDTAAQRYAEYAEDSEYVSEEDKEKAKKRRSEEHMKTLLAEDRRNKADAAVKDAEKRYAKTPLGKLSGAKDRISKGQSSIMKLLKRKK